MTIFKASRALTVRSAAIPEVSGAPALVPLKLQGREGINSLFHYTLALQTPDALQFSGIGSNFRLDDFIGREITCSIELEGMGSFQAGMPGGLGASHQGAGVREISGLITAARFCTEDHRHAIYELEIRPWLYLATLTTDCKVFQDKTPVEVIEAVLAGYNFASDKRLIETYPPRDYCVQYNETNFEFITRLMQEWGINYHFEHTAGVHRLVWSDHNGAFQATPQDQGEGPGACHDIPYYPLGHKIDREYIHGFSPTGRITSGAYATRDHDYTRPRATLEASARDPRPTGHADSEIYAWRGAKAGVGGSDYSQPRAGSDKGADGTEEQGRQLAVLRMQNLRQTGRRGRGVGHVRAIAPGRTFTLSGHPQQSANVEYMVLDTHFVIENVNEETQRGQTDRVRMNWKTVHVLPVIFVPGIMGSNLCNQKGEAIWLVNGPLTAGKGWTFKDASDRQILLHPDRTEVYTKGETPFWSVGALSKSKEFQARGWGEVSAMSYKDFLIWLEENLNGGGTQSNHATLNKVLQQVQYGTAWNAAKKYEPLTAAIRC